MSSTGATNLIYTEIDIEDIVKLSAQWSMTVGKDFISKELWIKHAVLGFSLKMILRLKINFDI